MLKSTKRPANKVPSSSAPALVAVIKNGMAEQEMTESGERWANHQGLYMTLAEVMDIEKVKAEKARITQDSSPD